uniref:FAD synthase n=1 Tax=Ditylenchus dipsaci TaxID=166011 RepID=A0A915ES42_9BILA
MCKRLHNLGVNVKKISVVSDDIEDIAKEVKVFSKSYDWVFTTGGIGPTHDDRTFAGLSKAFDDELEENAELRSFVQVFLRKTKLKMWMKLWKSFIPKSVKLIWGKTLPDQDSYEGISFPSFQLHNVISFPGVPRFCELSFKQIETSLFPTPDPFFSKVLFLKRNEIHLQNQLTQIAEMHSDKEVSIGSYPVMGNSYFKTKLITECSSHESGAKAYEDLLFAFQEHVINYDETPWENTMAKLNAFRDSQPQVFKDKIDGAIQTIDSILDEYGLENTSLSFNGGKDCTVLLHLLRCRVDHRYGCDTVIKGFHILHEDEFPELTEFVRDISSKYKLEVRQISGALKGGLAQLKVDQPNIVAVLMGSRSTDPKGKYMKSNASGLTRTGHIS